jgi:hypothetical protein
LYIDFQRLVSTIAEIDRKLLAQAGKAVNVSLTLRNWFIGLYIAEYELHGSDRAKYGENLLNELSRELRKKGISNTGRRQLYNYLSFYRIYPQIVRTLPAQLRYLLHPFVSKYQFELPKKGEMERFFEEQIKEIEYAPSVP